MPFTRKPARKPRVVRRTLADGSVKEYRYGPRQPKAPAPRIRPETLDALLAAYRRSPEFTSRAETTRAQYRIYLRDLDRIGHLEAKAVTRRELLTIRDAIADTRGPGAATAFVRCASAAFSWGVDRDMVSFNPLARVKALAKGSLPAWTVEQFQHALRAFPPHLARAVILARYTGQRRTDLCRMTWAAYDGAAIRLRQGKSRHQTKPVDLVIPCHPVLRAALEEWKPARATLTILANDKGNPWKPTDLSAAFRRECDKAGLPGLGVHGLRKLAAASLADAGASAHQIKAITGHRTLQMVAHYTESADQQKLATSAIALLPGARIAKRAKRHIKD